MKGVLTIETEKGELVIDLDKKELSAIRTLIIEREKVIMLANPTNAEEAQGKDKILKRLDKLQWWNW
jgi:hypothetical protein